MSSPSSRLACRWCRDRLRMTSTFSNCAANTRSAAARVDGRYLDGPRERRKPSGATSRAGVKGQRSKAGTRVEGQKGRSRVGSVRRRFESIEAQIIERLLELGLERLAREVLAGQAG